MRVASPTGSSRLLALLAISTATHVGLFAAWAAVYEATPPRPAGPARTVSAVRMVRQGRPPPPKPRPVKTPEPEPETIPEEPPDDPTPEPTRRRPGPPPPPPKACPGCAQVPATTKLASPRASAASAIPVGVPGGVPGGVIGGVPGGVVGGVVGGELGGELGAAAVAVPRKAAAPQPLAAVMARAIYSPDPDVETLRRTATGLLRGGSGINKTGFCIDTTGKVVDVRTSRRYPGDPKIDEECRRTVETWRFKPFLIGGKAAKVCTTVRFEIRFE